MKIEISQDDCESLHVDRDGTRIATTRQGVGVQGFDVSIGGLWLHFESEQDAEKLAIMILIRQGKWRVQ